MKKNIFEIIENFEIDIFEEMFKLKEEIEKQYYSLGNVSLEQFVDEHIFKEWKYNYNLIDLKHFKSKIGLSNISIYTNYKVKDFLMYIEYILNLIYLAPTKKVEINVLESVMTDKDFIEEELNQLKLYITSLLSKMNFDFKVIDEKNIKVIVLEKNPGATAVAEMIEDDDISRDIIRYNHFMLKGNLSEKKKILSQLYKEFEKIKDKLIANNNRKMASNCGMLFNALKIRHENHVDPEITKRVEDMTDVQLEEWYNKTYDLFLTCELVANYIDMGKDIKWLKNGVDDDI